MPKLVTPLFFALVGFFSSPITSAMPVTVVSDLPAARNQIEVIRQWSTQYSQMVSQINQLRQNYAAITGNGMYGVLNFDPKLVQYLPAEWKDVYGQVAAQEGSRLNSIAARIKKKEGFTSTTGGAKRYEDTISANQAMNMEAFDKTRARLDNINALMHKTNLTQNAKQAADLQNRIAAENAIIQNEQTRINLMLKLQEIELKLAEQQKDTEFRNKFFR